MAVRWEPAPGTGHPATDWSKYGIVWVIGVLPETEPAYFRGL